MNLEDLPLEIKIFVMLPGMAGQAGCPVRITEFDLLRLLGMVLPGAVAGFAADIVEDRFQLDKKMIGLHGVSVICRQGHMTD